MSQLTELVPMDISCLAYADDTCTNEISIDDYPTPAQRLDFTFDLQNAF